MFDSSSPVPAWSEQVALENVDGDVSYLKDLLEIFLRQTPQLLSQARDGLAAQDSKSVLLAAHTMKGSLQILGADSVASAAEQLEFAAMHDQLQEGTALLEVLDAQLTTITAQVVEFVNKH